MFKGKLICVCIYVLLIICAAHMRYFFIPGPLLAVADAFELFYDSVYSVLVRFWVVEVPLNSRSTHRKPRPNVTDLLFETHVMIATFPPPLPPSPPLPLRTRDVNMEFPYWRAS